MRDRVIIAGIIFIAIALMVFGGCSEKNEPTHPSQPHDTLLSLNDFEASQSCSTCHPQYYEEWNGSMHRYSTSDPIWRLANNALQASTHGRLKETCSMCHAPVGLLTGNTLPTFEFSQLNEKVREGISCDFCHVLRPPYKTTDQKVEYNVTPGRTKYGTLSDPIPTGAHDHGYDASYDRSEVCRQCHDLIVNSVPVEVTFTEWQQSQWGAMSFECQRCHMQTYTGRAAPNGPIRDNLHRHDFIGADIAIDDFPNKPAQRAAVDSLMKNAVSMSLSVPLQVNANESLRVSVTVTNDKTGHNVPTSVFFFRQMWIEVSAWRGTDTLYRSGYLDANGDLMDKYSALSPNEDRDLVMFGGTLYKDGEESNVFELDSLVNNSIPPFASRLASYRFQVPVGGPVKVRVRLLFRPFAPYLFRSLGAEQYISQLPIYEMNTDERTVMVVP